MSDLKDFKIEDGCLLKYKRKTGDVIIPDTVTEISAWAFSESEKISSVKIPDNVITIYDGAFKNCRKLADENGFVIIRSVLHGYFGGETASVPNGVKRIGSGAFSGCEVVTTVILPPSVIEIGSRAFSGCSSLSNIAIPDTVRNIEDFAFSECTSFIDENGFLVVNNTLYNYYGKDATAIIPSGVKHIDMMAFTNENAGNSFVTSIILPEGLENIGDYAFQNCNNLTEITIPDSVKQFGENLLAGCDNLDTISASDEIVSKVWEQLGTKQKNNIILKAAKDGTGGEFLKEKIKASKKKLLEQAIANDDAALTDNVLSLFTKIPLDELDAYIQKASSAPQVTAFLLNYKNTTHSTDKQEAHETDKIEKELGLKERTPADWRKIFNYKKTDKGIVITGYKGQDVDIVVPAMIGADKVIEIADGAFSPYVEKLPSEISKNRSAIRSINIPFGIKKIGKYTFYGCRALTCANIADSVTSVGENAFEHCTLLVDITLSQKMKTINAVTFASCHNLAELILPKGITSIGIAAFADCEKLKAIYIPSAVTKIGNRARYGNAHTFVDSPNLTIHAPAGSYAEQYAKKNNIPFVAEE